MMAKAILTQESFADMPFPLGGVDLLHAFDEQRPGTTPLGTNVRGYEASALRFRGGQRAGLSKFINSQVGGVASKIQHLNIIVDPTVDALLDEINGPLSSGIPDTGDADFGPEDSSSAGAPSSWGQWGTRNPPGWHYPKGGWGVQPNKNRKLTPKIVWANPADITSGTPLSGTQLNAVAEDPITLAVLPGTYVYSPPSGTVLPPGMSESLRVTFTATNTKKYRRASKSVHINVTGSLAADGHAVGSAKVIGFSRIPFSVIVNEVTGSPLSFPVDQTASFPTPVSSGDLLVIGILLDSAFCQCSQVTDTLGNAYTKIVERGGTGSASLPPPPDDKGLYSSVWKAVSGASGSCTVTYTLIKPTPGTTTDLVSYACLCDLTTTTVTLDGTSALFQNDPSGHGTGSNDIASTTAGTPPIAGSNETVIGFLRGWYFNSGGPDNPTLTPENGLVLGAAVKDQFSYFEFVAIVYGTGINAATEVVLDISPSADGNFILWEVAASFK